MISLKRLRPGLKRVFAETGMAIRDSIEDAEEKSKALSKNILKKLEKSEQRIDQAFSRDSINGVEAEARLIGYELIEGEIGSSGRSLNQFSRMPSEASHHRSQLLQTRGETDSAG